MPVRTSMLKEGGDASRVYSISKINVDSIDGDDEEQSVTNELHMVA